MMPPYFWAACIGMWKAAWTPPRKRTSRTVAEFPCSDMVRDAEEARDAAEKDEKK